MRHRGNILVLVAGIGLAASYSIDGASADARRGQALAEEWCSSCHAVAPNAARNPAAPAFAEIAAEPLQPNTASACSCGRRTRPCRTLYLSRTKSMTSLAISALSGVTGKPEPPRSAAM